ARRHTMRTITPANTTASPASPTSPAVAAHTGCSTAVSTASRSTNSRTPVPMTVTIRLRRSCEVTWPTLSHPFRGAAVAPGGQSDEQGSPGGQVHDRPAVEVHAERRAGERGGAVDGT